MIIFLKTAMTMVGNYMLTQYMPVGCGTCSASQ